MTLLEILLKAARALRLPMAAASAVAAGALFSQAASTYNYVLMDYLAWAAFLAVALAVLGDFSAHWRRYGHASTLTLDLVALGLAAAGRASSSALSLWASGITSPIFGGSINGQEPLAAALLVCPASIICTGSVLANTIAKQPISFDSTASYYEVFSGLQARAARIWSIAERHPIQFAFLIGLSVRAIPEMIWWPWLVGWDTVEYAAHLEDFLADPRFFSAYYWMGSMRNMPPMIDWVLAAPAALFGSLAVYKVYPPVAYGVMIGLVAAISRRALGMDGKRTLVASALSALFILNLRISWDYQRQVLGTLFLLGFFAVQGGLEGGKFRKGGSRVDEGDREPVGSIGDMPRWSIRSLALPLLMLLGAALSHEVTAFASALILIYLLFVSAAERHLLPSTCYSVALACTVALLIWYFGRPVSTNAYFGAVPVGLVSNPSESNQVISYVVAGFGVVLPLAFMGMRDAGGAYRVALLGLLAAGVTPLVIPYTSVVTWYRFLIGAAPLAVPLAVKAVSECRRREALAALALLIAVPGVVYLHPNGSYYTSMLTGAYREFAQNMVPCPASVYSQEAIMAAAPVAASFIGAGTPNVNGGGALDIPLVADSDDARFVHLFVRNPTPDEFVWARVDGWTINATMNRLGIDEVLLFTRMSANSLNQLVNSFSYVGSFNYFEITSLSANGSYAIFKISRNTLR